MIAKKNLLICGATGFIGRNMVEYFSKQPGYHVIAVYHNRKPYHQPNVTWVPADLRRVEDIEKVIKNVDIIIQAAATTSGSKDILLKPMVHVTDNMVMNSLLFRAAHEAGVKHILFFSCTVMYQSSEDALKEEDFNPSNEIHPRYFGVGWTKVALEKQSEFYARLGTTKYTVLRHSNIYGPHDKFDLERSHVFGATVTKVMSADPGGTITVWGTGEEARDLLYIDDLTQCAVLALEKQQDPFQLFNVGYGSAVSIKDLVHKIVALSKRNLIIEHDISKPTIKTSLFLDCNHVMKKLGWHPEVTLDEGILKTLAWWEKYIGSQEKRSIA